MPIRRSIAGIDSPDRLAEALRDAQYLADDGLATAAYLALALGKPLLLEGAPGVGKTEAREGHRLHPRPRADPPAVLTRASTPPTRSTNGTTRARCWPSARPATNTSTSTPTTS